MRTRRVFQRGLSVLLAAGLLLAQTLPAGASEFSQETGTVEPETTAAALLSETSAPTEPSEEPSAEEPVSTEEPESTQETVSTQEPVFTEETEPTVMETQAPLLRTAAPTLTTIAQAQAMPAGTENITIQGIVVFAGGTQAVLQDETGGIRRSFGTDPGAALGDVLLVTGVRSGGFFAVDYEKTGTADLPAVERTLLDAPENLRILVKNAVLGWGSLCQDGFSLSMTGSLPAGAAVGDTADVYGVILDGRFYADTILPQAAAESSSADPDEWNLYFGQLHSHTNLSDGTGSVEEAYAYAADVAGLDFFAVTDHSNSFDNALLGAIGQDGAAVSAEWAAGKAAAASATDGEFVGIFGYEMTWKDALALGHMNTFATPGWQTPDQTGFETLKGYYDALTTVPDSISQFNHPNSSYGDFNGFSGCTPAYDSVIQLLEVGGEHGATAYDAYTQALDAGWHVAPTNNQSNHSGSWGTESAARTVVLAGELTEQSLYDAMRSRRVYATQDSDLAVIYRLNGSIQGSILGPADMLTAGIFLKDPTDAGIGTVEVVVDGGKTAVSQTVAETETVLTLALPVGYCYYYPRITQFDGDVAVTAPVWVDSYENMGISGFTADPAQPEQGQEVNLTLELFNEETVEFSLENLTISQDGTVIHQVSAPGTVGALGSFSYTVPYTWQEAGELELQASVTGTVAGQTRTYQQTLILHCQPAQITVSTIAQARSGQLGEAYRVKGYVTAGNANAFNTFPNTLYLQDDTGGIAVEGSFVSGIQVGAPMEVTGCLRREGGNLVLEMTDYALPEEDFYRYVPRTMTHAVAMDYAAHGGELLQIVGTVVSLTKTADGGGISRLTLKDTQGDLATVVIEDYIGSGAYGTNDLASQIRKGRTVRAMGLLHVDEYGTTVLRVRNCEEVVYVPPVADYSNPKTGDMWRFWK